MHAAGSSSGSLSSAAATAAAAHHHHHQTHHLQMSFTSVSAAYAPHLPASLAAVHHHHQQQQQQQLHHQQHQQHGHHHVLQPHQHHHSGQLQHSQHNQHHQHNQHLHPHHPHLGQPLMHPSHAPNFHHSAAPLHHPQPLPFTPLSHSATHHSQHTASVSPVAAPLAAGAALTIARNAVSAFEFTAAQTVQSDGIGFKPHMPESLANNNNNNNNNSATMNNNNVLPPLYQQQQHVVFAASSPTHSQRSGISCGGGGPMMSAVGGRDDRHENTSESLGSESPPLIVDNLPGSPISLCNSSNSNGDGGDGRRSAPESAVAPEDEDESRCGGAAEPGSSLLDILMHPDRCQELIQYQATTANNQVTATTSAQVAPVGAASGNVAVPEVRVGTWEVLQETSARLLFMAVHWVRWQGTIQTLGVDDQEMLLQESWKEIFLLHLAQWAVPCDLGHLLDSALVRERLTDDALTASELKTMQEILCRFRQIAPDTLEINYMKAITLFSASGPLALRDIRPLEMLQDQAQCILNDHVRLRYPRQPTRFGRLLLVLPSLRSIRKQTIETLFFKETIGSVPIERLLRNMYHAERGAVAAEVGGEN